MSALRKMVQGVRRAFARETMQPAPAEPLPSPPKPMVGLFATMSLEQQKQALNFVGDHNFGENR